jgi:hypothetical protein
MQPFCAGRLNTVMLYTIHHDEISLSLLTTSLSSLSSLSLWLLFFFILDGNSNKMQLWWRHLLGPGASRVEWVPWQQQSTLYYRLGDSTNNGKLDSGNIHCRVTDPWNNVTNTLPCQLPNVATGGQHHAFFFSVLVCTLLWWCIPP